MTNPKTYSDGTKIWLNNDGQLHRLEGPVSIWANGEVWYQNDKRHRLDGPAVEFANGTSSYWINDQQLTKAEWNVHPLRKDYIIKENLKLILHD